MKKLIFCLSITIGCILCAKAQDGERIFKRFKGDVSMGFAAPIGSNSNGGFLFAMEPKIALIDKLYLGLRIEGAIMARFSGSYHSGDAVWDNARASGSHVLTADYYFTNNYSFRPFVGAGAGVFALVADDTNFSDEITATKFGGIFRVGGEVKHFRFGVEYNIIPDTDVYINNYDNMGNSIVTRGKLNNAYIGIKFGFCFGGGPL